MSDATDITIPINLLESLAPAEPMSQDEQGGCVWCGGGDGYARPIAEDHHDSCAWLRARTLLCTTVPTITMRQCYPEDPAVARIPGLTLTERQQRAYVRRRDTLIIAEASPTQAVALSVLERGHDGTGSIRLFYVAGNDHSIARALFDEVSGYVTVYGVNKLRTVDVPDDSLLFGFLPADTIRL